MKKLYMLAGGILIATLSFGQNGIKSLQPVPFSVKAIKTGGPLQAKPAPINPTQYSSLLKAPPLYQQDFEGVTPPALPAGMTTTSLATDGGFYTGTSVEANAGGYWPVAAHTKFAMTNDDFCGEPCDKSQDMLILPQLDFTGQTGLSISFAAFNDGNFGGGDATVEMNVNNGGWNIIYTMPVLEAWQNLVVAIPSNANNQADVKFRFHWDDAGSWATGLAIDDITVAPPNSNDISVTKKYFYGISDSTATEYYTRIPQRQAQLDELIFGADISNLGSNNQPNTKLTATVSGSGSFSGTSAAKTLNAFSADSFDVTTSFFANNQGTYNVSFAASSDSTDINPQNNTVTASYMVTDSVYARDNNIPSGAFWYGAGQNYSIGNLYAIYGDDTATSISWFVPNFQPAGKTISLKILDFGVDPPVVMASYDFYDTKASDKNNWITLPIAPTPLPPGLYAAVMESSSDTVVFSGGTGAPPAPPLTVFVDPDMSGTWYYTTSTQFIRLNTKGIPNACTASLTSTITHVACNGGNTGSINLTVNGGTGPFSYAWSNAATTEDISNLAAGTYSVTVTYGTSCTVNASYTVTQPATALATAVTNTDACSGSTNGTATATPSGGTSPYTYLWSNSQTGQTATALAAGTYTVTVTDSKGCTTTGNTTVVATNITANATPTATTCGNNDGSVTVTASGGTSPYNYVWSSTPVQITATATGLASGSYTVSVTDSKGCTQTASATVAPSTGVTASTASTDANCSQQDGSASVSVSPVGTQYTYQWNVSAGSQTTSTATGLGAGTYDVTVTDNVDSCTATAIAIVGNINAPTVTVASTTDITCNGGSDGEIDITVSGGTPGYTYLWTPDSAITEDISNLTAGTYIVEVTDNATCKSYKVVTLTEPPAISATILSFVPPLCNGGTDGSVDLAASGGTGALTFLWSNASITEDLTGVGANTYTVTVTDADGCTQTATATVTEPTVITATATFTAVTCNGASTGTATVNASGGTSPYSYAWSNAQTGQTITGLASGSYTVTVTDVNGCTKDATTTVTQPNTLNVTANGTNETVPPGNNGSVSTTVTGGTAPFTYAWNNGQQSATAIGLAAGTYSVTVTDASGCTSTNMATITADTTVGIFGTLNSQAIFTLFPNPNNGLFNVQLNNANGQYFLEVRNIIGQILYMEKITTNGNLTKQIDLSNVGQGVYFLNVSGDDLNKTHKVVVK